MNNKFKTKRGTLCSGLLFAACMATTAPQEKSNIHALAADTQKVKYKTAGEYDLHLYIDKPADFDPGKAYKTLVWFYGGGWNGGNALIKFSQQTPYFTSRGLMVIRPEYRTKSPHGAIPMDSLKDAKSAMRYIVKHAAELNVDPDNIVAGGSSAGGHLAAALATTTKINDAQDDLSIPTMPRALTLFNPVYDNGPTGYGYSRVKDYYQDFSPMHNIHKDMPPTLTQLGTEDKLIPVETGKMFKQKMEALGVRSDLILYEGAGHGFFHKARYKESLLAIDEFLQSLGILEGPATIQLPENDGGKEAVSAQNDEQLINAVRKKDHALVNELLDAGADVNARDKKYQAPLLIFAALNNDEQMIQLLLDFGADKSLTNKGGKTAYQLAKQKGHNDLLPLLDPE